MHGIKSEDAEPRRHNSRRATEGRIGKAFSVRLKHFKMKARTASSSAVLVLLVHCGCDLVAIMLCSASMLSVLFRDIKKSPIAESILRHNAANGIDRGPDSRTINIPDQDSGRSKRRRPYDTYLSV